MERGGPYFVSSIFAPVSSNSLNIWFVWNPLGPVADILLGVASMRHAQRGTQKHLANANACQKMMTKITKMIRYVLDTSSWTLMAPFRTKFSPKWPPKWHISCSRHALEEGLGTPSRRNDAHKRTSSMQHVQNWWPKLIKTGTRTDKKWTCL